MSRTQSASRMAKETGECRPETGDSESETE
jgi:hypothetical protein